MRVAVVTETYPPEVNGVALTVHALVSGMAEDGHELLLVRGAALSKYPGLRLGFPAGRTLARLFAAHFASTDLFLFPSLTETFGNVTLEAMASGVPTVAVAADADLRRSMGTAARRAALALRPERVSREFVGVLQRLTAGAAA